MFIKASVTNMPGLKIKKKTITRYHVTSKIIIILIYAVNIFNDEFFFDEFNIL